MKYPNIVILMLLFSGICDAMTSVKKIDNTPVKSDFDTFIKGVNNGDENWLNSVPAASDKIKIEQSNDLRNALIHSLIISPSKTLDALNEIDKIIAIKGHSFIIDKFGTDSVCSYIINSNEYDKYSFFEYYKIAKLKLEKTKDKGKSCLELMKSSVGETIHEENNGAITWGKKKYSF